MYPEAIERTDMKRTLIIVGLVIIAATAVVMGDPTGPQSPPPDNPDPPTPPTPPGPQGGPLGAGCIGGPGQAVMFGVTRTDFRALHPNRPWIQGSFSPTDPVSPCNLGGFD